MSAVGQPEIHTQRRVIAFFQEALGYAYLGNWRDRPDNRNIEPALLGDWLAHQGHTSGVIDKALRDLNKAAALAGNTTLYEANRKVYGLLRYAVKVRPDLSAQNATVWLIDWSNPDNNDFAIAEEVTVSGAHTKRPDLVLYVNGIALGVLELKRSTVSVAEGIRQNLDNQNKTFIRPFFTSVQLLMAGNDTQGLRYGVIETPEKYWLRWKEADAHPEAGDKPLLRELGQLCRKERLLELVHDFMVFDAGVKKTCRHNQYFGVQAARQRVRRREGGIIWHTQGSGKSLTMVWLAKWLREQVAASRVLIVTDRTELDEQIERVFKGVGEHIYRTQSGADLAGALRAGNEWLLCSLIHKFGLDEFLSDLRSRLPHGFQPAGEVFVFVDECHRTQSGTLHRAMKTLLPGAMLIGFTGTPLLKADRQRSIETFGPYIHTYKYDEAAHDRVVLELRYEARNIDQHLSSRTKIDHWFELKTRGLSDGAKAQLRQRWGTLRRVLSSRNRLTKIVADILLDMETRDRLKSGRGNALLVSDSISSACRFFALLQDTELADKCAVVTSYRPAPANIKGEESGEGLTEKLLQYEAYRKMLAAHFNEPEDIAVSKVEQFEREIKKRFVDEPGRLKLLIVVDKLLTGFDAPPATYLYIDKQMQDHALFQAICRVNRLDGEDKEYGSIIDYKDLFRSLEQSIRDYTGAAFEGYDAADVSGLLTDRRRKGRERLEEVREQLRALCEPVEPPRDTVAYVRFFCPAGSDHPDHAQRKRTMLYQLAGSFLRAYAELANEMPAAGYSAAQAQELKAEVAHYEKVRQEVKLASGDYIDLKLYEPAMRHLLDTYIRAEESQALSTFDDLTLTQLIAEQGQDGLAALPAGLRDNPEALAETIENNVRRLIIDQSAVNPRYYERMSAVLDALIYERKREAMDYQAYLAKIVELTKQVQRPDRGQYPLAIHSRALRALYDNLKESQGLERAVDAPLAAESPADRAEAVALSVDEAVRRIRKADWRSNRFKEREVLNAISTVLQDAALTSRIFEIVKAQRDY